MTSRQAKRFLSALIMTFLSPAVTDVFLCVPRKLPSFSLGSVSKIPVEFVIILSSTNAVKAVASFSFACSRSCFMLSLVTYPKLMLESSSDGSNGLRQPADYFNHFLDIFFVSFHAS